MTTLQGVARVGICAGLDVGGVYWFATFGLLVLRSYPFWKIHQTLSTWNIFSHKKFKKFTVLRQVAYASE